MKIFTLLAAAAASIATVSGYNVIDRQYVDISIEYSIVQTPEITEKNVAQWVNGDEVTLQYKLENNEKSVVTVIGVGGMFANPVTNEIVTNLTRGQIGPITVAPGTSSVFEQRIGVDLIPDNYQLVPQVFIAHEDLIKVVACRGQLASVADKSISFFDPRLIFLELVLIASLAGLGYLVYDIWGKRYFAATQPVKVKKTTDATKVTSTGSGYDVNWVPESHLKQKKTKKVA
ncbi:IRC22 [Candida oxycetoniae]|uniref:IRC22 n=1 Tax=Candida oxycetoniae TaxID=497107 RepID=A0AAI9SU93_9ASCO|nr:IRC22 [Candida oxycetoniae]KAI3403137.1 IRC22 [Candida oxycetoniae]